MGADVKKMDITRTVLPLEHYGSPEIVSFRGLPGGDDKDHFALIFTSRHGDPKDPLVRIHSECVTGDVLGSLRCDCGKQLEVNPRNEKYLQAKERRAARVAGSDVKRGTVKREE
jgi:GTP cyclohydrolase II